jgi:hypothetical protein
MISSSTISGMPISGSPVSGQVETFTIELTVKRSVHFVLELSY